MTVVPSYETGNLLRGMVAPLSGQSVALQKAVVTNGIREVRFIIFINTSVSNH